MDMKFSKHRFFRESGDCCRFIEVLSVLVDTGEVAELEVQWHKTLNNGWKRISPKPERMWVRPTDYGRWVWHYPRGEKIE